MRRVTTALAAARLKLPPLVGYLIAGIITERGIFRAPYTESLAGAFNREAARA